MREAIVPRWWKPGNYAPWSDNGWDLGRGRVDVVLALGLDDLAAIVHSSRRGVALINGQRFSQVLHAPLLSLRLAAPEGSSGAGSVDLFLADGSVLRIGHRWTEAGCVAFDPDDGASHVRDIITDLSATARCIVGEPYARGAVTHETFDSWLDVRLPLARMDDSPVEEDEGGRERLLNWGFRVRHPAQVDRLLCPKGTSAPQTFFHTTGQRPWPRPEELQDLRSAAESIIGAAYCFTHVPTARAIADSPAPLKVVLLDRGMAQKRNAAEALEILSAGGVHLLPVDGTDFCVLDSLIRDAGGIFHHKSFAVDGRVLWNGTANQTYHADANCEVRERTTTLVTVTAYVEHFCQIIRRLATDQSLRLSVWAELQDLRRDLAGQTAWESAARWMPVGLPRPVQELYAETARRVCRGELPTSLQEVVEEGMARREAEVAELRAKGLRVA